MAKAQCEECGGDAIPHRIAYITVLLDDFLRPLFTPNAAMRAIASPFFAAERLLTPRFLSFLADAGVAKRLDEWDDETPLLGQMLWKEAKERGIRVWECRLFGLPRNLYVAEWRSGRRLAYEGIPIPPAGASQAWWMDNKGILKREFRKRGMPVANGGGVLTPSGARRLLATLAAPVIVKPHSGSASRHTTLHVKDEEALARAFRVAREVAPLAVVEEELIGPVYRATVVDGQLAAALRRDKPTVTGDGMRTVRELVDEENRNPKRQGPHFHPMRLEDAEKELSWQGLSAESVPAAGRQVTLHEKINWSVGGTTADVTDDVHSDNRALFEEVARVLKAPVVGIDFIIEDIGRSWKETERCGVIECNSMPFFDNHHLPFSGQPRNVAGRILDMIEGK